MKPELAEPPLEPPLEVSEDDERIVTEEVQAIACLSAPESIAAGTTGHLLRLLATEQPAENVEKVD